MAAPVRPWHDGDAVRKAYRLFLVVGQQNKGNKRRALNLAQLPMDFFPQVIAHPRKTDDLSLGLIAPGMGQPPGLIGSTIAR